MSAGWVIFTLTTMGKQLLGCKITGWSPANPDVDEGSFEMTWKV